MQQHIIYNKHVFILMSVVQQAQWLVLPVVFVSYDILAY
jgi:hypothetical protein